MSTKITKIRHDRHFSANPVEDFANPQGIREPQVGYHWRETKTDSQNKRSANSNPGRAKYEAGIFTTILHCSLWELMLWMIFM